MCFRIGSISVLGHQRKAFEQSVLRKSQQEFKRKVYHAQGNDAVRGVVYSEITGHYINSVSTIPSGSSPSATCNLLTNAHTKIYMQYIPYGTVTLNQQIIISTLTLCRLIIHPLRQFGPKTYPLIINRNCILRDGFSTLSSRGKEAGNILTTACTRIHPL